MRDVFISYRQDDAKPWALLLREALAKAFGEAKVFLDKDSLHAGNWHEQLQSVLDKCSVVLVVIGRRWTSAADKHGRRRLEQEDDVHRQEIIMALSRPGVTVIPVLVDNAAMPGPQDLPKPLQPLAAQQARELSDNALKRSVDLNLLIGDIEHATGLKAKSASEKNLWNKSLRTLGTGLRIFLIASLTTLALVTGFDLLGGTRVGPMETLVVFMVVLPVVVALDVRRRRRN